MIDTKKTTARTVSPATSDTVVPGGKTAHDMSDSPSTTTTLERIKVLEEQVAMLTEADRRSKADYQNLLRRTQEERSRLIKLATSDFVTELLQPLDHLSLAAEQLNDAGLNMVIKQFWMTLHAHGLQEIEVLNQEFDPTTMEAIERHGNSTHVTKVVTRGYRLHGEVLRHAKVIVGEPTTRT